MISVSNDWLFCFTEYLNDAPTWFILKPTTDVLPKGTKQKRIIEVRYRSELPQQFLSVRAKAEVQSKQKEPSFVTAFAEGFPITEIREVDHNESPNSKHVAEIGNKKFVVRMESCEDLDFRVVSKTEDVSLYADYKSFDDGQLWKRFQPIDYEKDRWKRALTKGSYGDKEIELKWDPDTEAAHPFVTPLIGIDLRLRPSGHDRGIMVLNVYPNSPAERFGLKDGDLVTEVTQSGSGVGIRPGGDMFLVNKLLAGLGVDGSVKVRRLKEKRPSSSDAWQGCMVVKEIEIDELKTKLSRQSTQVSGCKQLSLERSAKYGFYFVRHVDREAPTLHRPVSTDDNELSPGDILLAISGRKIGRVQGALWATYSEAISNSSTDGVTVVHILRCSTNPRDKSPSQDEPLQAMPATEVPGLTDVHLLMARPTKAAKEAAKRAEEAKKDAMRVLSSVEHAGKACRSAVKETTEDLEEHGEVERRGSISQLARGLFIRSSMSVSPSFDFRERLSNCQQQYKATQAALERSEATHGKADDASKLYSEVVFEMERAARMAAKDDLGVVFKHMCSTLVVTTFCRELDHLIDKDRQVEEFIKLAEGELRKDLVKVDFSSEETAAAVMEEFQGHEGLKIEYDYAFEENQSTLVVSSIKKSLLELATSVKLLLDQKKGFLAVRKLCYVEFDSMEHAADAMARFKDKFTKAREVTVDYCRSGNEPIVSREHTHFSPLVVDAFERGSIAHTQSIMSERFASLQHQDIICAVHGEPVFSPKDFKRAIERAPPVFELRVRRDARRATPASKHAIAPVAAIGGASPVKNTDTMKQAIEEPNLQDPGAASPSPPETAALEGSELMEELRRAKEKVTQLEAAVQQRMLPPSLPPSPPSSPPDASPAACALVGTVALASISPVNEIMAENSSQLEVKLAQARARVLELESKAYSSLLLPLSPPFSPPDTASYDSGAPSAAPPTSPSEGPSSDQFTVPYQQNTPNYNAPPSIPSIVLSSSTPQTLRSSISERSMSTPRKIMKVAAESKIVKVAAEKLSAIETPRVLKETPRIVAEAPQKLFHGVQEMVRLLLLV